MTCLVDLLRPSVAHAAVRLLEQAGFEVVVPAQTCCGQAHFNSGDRSGARAMALNMLGVFEACDHVVVPSGSCAAMLICHYAELFEAGSADRRRAEELAARTHELTRFLVEVAHFEPAMQALSGTATYHDGCSGLRELGVREQPRALLQNLDGIDLVEMRERDACCGFGGLFCVKYDEISTRIAEQKLADVAATGADYLVGGDVGCLMHLEGMARRRGQTLEVLHVAEALTGLRPEAD